MSKPQRLPSGAWRVRWIDERGKRRSATFRTEAAAKAGLRRALVEVDDVRSGRAAPKVEAPLFRAFVNERWLKTYPAAAGNRERTVVEKTIHVERHLMPHLGHLRLDQIRGEAVDKLFAALNAKLAPKSVKNIRATLGTILRSAKKWGELADVPELPRVKVPQREWHWLTAADSEKLLAAAVDPEERTLLLFALHTGARFGEQRAITWGDIDWQNRLVVIRRSMPHGTEEVGPTKSGRERRIPMTDSLHTALKSIRDLRHLKGGLVFCRRRDGGALSLYAVRERLGRACRKAGVLEIRWHDLRHSFASQLVSAGVPLRQVQEWLGHSTIAMTERYSHLAPGGGGAIRALDARPSEWTRGGHEERGPGYLNGSEPFEVTPSGLEPVDLPRDITKLPKQR